MILVLMGVTGSGKTTVGELLVKVRAAGVNPVDYKIRRGKYPAVKEDKLPYTPGRDVAGSIEKVGPDVLGFAVGELVYGMPGIERGGYAEFVKSPAVNVVPTGFVPRR